MCALYLSCKSWYPRLISHTPSYSTAVLTVPSEVGLLQWVAQSIERATPGEEVPGSIPAVAARSLLVGSV